MFVKKAEAFARRVALGAKHHITRAYHEGRTFATKLNRSYETFKKIHGAMAPALKDIAPEAAKHTKKIMEGYERTRAQVLGAHETAERAVHSVKKALPELGL